LSHSVNPLDIGYFRKGLTLYLATWIMMLLFVLPCIAGMTVAHYAFSHWLRWGLVIFFSGLTWNHNLPNLTLSCM
jgi:hypothetical protein